MNDTTIEICRELRNRLITTRMIERAAPKMLRFIIFENLQAAALTVEVMGETDVAKQLRDIAGRTWGVPAPEIREPLWRAALLHTSLEVRAKV